MAKRKFTDNERYAIYTVHGEKCYLCNKPVDLYSMEVDHVIPVSLSKKPSELEKVIVELGLPKDFNIQSFENWLPSCGRCNSYKLNKVFKPSPLIQLILQNAAIKAPRTRKLSEKIVSNKAVTRAWNTIKRAASTGNLENNIQKDIHEFVQFHELERENSVTNEPILLSPLIEVIKEESGIRTIKGPYGIGSGHVSPDVHSSFFCPTCGHSAWNGARCVVCGEMSDD